MKIGELWADDERPTIDGDWIRGILVLGRASKNPADTDGPSRGKSKVTRKFNVICESAALYAKFDGAPAHIGPHQFDGAYPDDALMGTFHNPASTAKGLRMDLQCRKVGESYHPQALALRDNIEHSRPFGGFSPLFDGDTDQATGEVRTVEAVAGIDWVPNPGSVKSIVESSAGSYEDLLGRIAECDERYAKHIAECDARYAKHIAECTAPNVAESKSEGGARTVPPPSPSVSVHKSIDPFKFIRSGA